MRTPPAFTPEQVIRFLLIRRLKRQVERDLFASTARSAFGLGRLL